jgi:hypothetical protein
MKECNLKSMSKVQFYIFMLSRHFWNFFYGQGAPLQCMKLSLFMVHMIYFGIEFFL